MAGGIGQDLIQQFGNTGSVERMVADCFVEVAGKDVTSKYDPYLLTATILDKEEMMDECTIELDHGKPLTWGEGGGAGSANRRTEQIKPPKPGETIAVSLGWPGEGSFKVFTGYVHDIEGSGQRRSGRRLHIIGRGAKQTGKQQQDVSLGEGDKSEENGQQSGGAGGGGGGSGGSGGSGGGQDEGHTLEEFLQKAAKAAGYTMDFASPEVGQVKRPYWLQHSESFHQLGLRLARENGGIFKIAGNKATITSRTGFARATGTVRASEGYNLIAWRLRPFSARGVWGSGRSRWFDPAAAVMKFESNTATSDVAKSAKEVFTDLFDRGVQGQSKEQSRSDMATGKRERGGGWIVINGEPQAHSQGKCNLKGVGEGFDGEWKIRQAEHQYSRAQGFITRLDVIEPGLTSNIGE